MATLRAARVEQEIVKIPQDEVVVAFGEPEIVAARRIDFEKDLAIDQESEKLDPWKIVPADAAL